MYHSASSITRLSYHPTYQSNLNITLCLNQSYSVIMLSPSQYKLSVITLFILIYLPRYVHTCSEVPAAQIKGTGHDFSVVRKTPLIIFRSKEI